MRSRYLIYLWADAESPQVSARHQQLFHKLEIRLNSLSGKAGYFRLLYGHMAKWMAEDDMAVALERAPELFHRLITSGMDLMTYAGLAKKEALLLVGGLIDLKINQCWMDSHFYQLVLKLMKRSSENKDFLSGGPRKQLLDKYRIEYPENYFRFFIAHDFST